MQNKSGFLNDRGDITILLTVLSVFLMLGGIAVGTLLTQKQTRTTSNAQAAGYCTTDGAWVDTLPTPVGSSTGYKMFRWKNTSCALSARCHVTGDCSTLANNSQPTQVNAASSFGCYGYQGSTNTWDDFRCIHVVAVDSAGNPLAGSGYTPPTGNSVLASQASPTPGANPTSNPAPTAATGAACAATPWDWNGDHHADGACGASTGYPPGSCGGPRNAAPDLGKYFLCRTPSAADATAWSAVGDTWYGPCNTLADCNAAQTASGFPTTAPNQPTVTPAPNQPTATTAPNQPTATPTPNCLANKGSPPLACTPGNSCVAWTYGGVNNEYASWVNKYLKCQQDQTGQYYWYGPCNTQAACTYLSPTPVLPTPTLAPNSGVSCQGYAIGTCMQNPPGLSDNNYYQCNYLGTFQFWFGPYGPNCNQPPVKPTLSPTATPVPLNPNYQLKINVGTSPSNAVRSSSTSKFTLVVTTGQGTTVLNRVFSLSGMGLTPAIPGIFALGEIPTNYYQTGRVPGAIPPVPVEANITSITIRLYSTTGSGTSVQSIPFCGNSARTINQTITITDPVQIKNIFSPYSSVPIILTIDCSGSVASAVPQRLTKKDLQNVQSGYIDGTYSPQQASIFLVDYVQYGQVPGLQIKFCDPTTGACTPVCDSTTRICQTPTL